MRVQSVNTGRVRPLRAGTRTVMSAIGKAPVTGPAAVGPFGLQGDEHTEPTVHGGLCKAVHAHPSQHLAERRGPTVRIAA